MSTNNLDVVGCSRLSRARRHGRSGVSTVSSSHNDHLLDWNRPKPKSLVVVAALDVHSHRCPSRCRRRQRPPSRSGGTHPRRGTTHRRLEHPSATVLAETHPRRTCSKRLLPLLTQLVDGRQHTNSPMQHAPACLGRTQPSVGHASKPWGRCSACTSTRSHSPPSAFVGRKADGKRKSVLGPNSQLYLSTRPTRRIHLDVKPAWLFPVTYTPQFHWPPFCDFGPFFASGLGPNVPARVDKGPASPPHRSSFEFI